MKKPFLLVLLWAAVMPWGNIAGAADCICPKFPAFPYPGGNWLHYSLYYEDCADCGQSTVTGYICPLSPPLDCPDCIALAADTEPTLEYVRSLKGFSAKDTPSEASVSDDMGVKAFLDKVQPGTNPELWKDAKFTKSTRLNIRRKIADSPEKYDDFSVALYKFQYKGQPQRGGVGIQIQTIPSSTAYVPKRFRVPCIDDSETVYETLPGVIKVFFNDEWWIVRIDDSAENNTAFAFPTADKP